MKVQTQMQFAKVLMTIIALWPARFSDRKLKLYQMYFYLEFMYFILSDVICQGITIFTEDNTLLDASTNLGVTIVYAINIYRVLVCKSKNMTMLLEAIEEKEQTILTSADEDVKRIYKNNIKYSFNICLFYVLLGTSGFIMYLFNPIIELYILGLDENGQKKQSLIYPSWFPFDPIKYYWIAYSLEAYGAFLGYAYIVYCGSLFLCILKYCIGQIKMLQHYLRNVNSYSLKYSQQHKMSKAKGQELFIKLCIKEHQSLIKFIEQFNKSIRTYVLLEFVVSSAQLALVVYQFLESSSGVEKLRVFLYLTTLCCQLYLFYWNGHQIVIESQNIANAIFESDWFALDNKPKKMLQLLILKSQKPLGVTIGPFKEVKIESLIAIFKAIYSYVAFMQTR